MWEMRVAVIFIYLLSCLVLYFKTYVFVSCFGCLIIGLICLTLVSAVLFYHAYKADTLWSNDDDKGGCA